MEYDRCHSFKPEDPSKGLEVLERIGCLIFGGWVQFTSYILNGALLLLRISLDDLTDAAVHYRVVC